jgi:hypothetical protein
MNPQPFKFHSYTEFFEQLSEQEKPLVSLLDELIRDLIPDVKRKLSYNVPYYSLQQRICFIWPASVPWGNVKLSGVQLGFCKGYLLNDPENFLKKENRKQVYVKTFYSLGDIERDMELIKNFLEKAVHADKK